jgi:hypothetical protein
MRLRLMAGILFAIGLLMAGVLPAVILGANAVVSLTLGCTAGVGSASMMYVTWRVFRPQLESQGYRW